MRLLTSLLIIGLSAFAIIDGWCIASFARLRPEVAAGGASADALRRWVGIPGVTGAALQAALTPMRGAADRKSVV